MSLLSYGNNPGATPQSPLRNNGFWPDIEPAAFRSVERIDSGMTAERVAHALAIAVADINRQLAEWQQQHVDTGATAVGDVLPPAWSTSDHYPLLYLRAVYATAHASLLERYRDYSATQRGDDLGEAKDAAAEDYRRDARWAVAEIIGTTHTTVDLI